jgi:hypothetical protein
MISARGVHTATRLPSGKVLVAGGHDFYALDSAELYDPAANTWSAAGTLSATRSYASATLLPDGKALVAGGRDFRQTASGLVDAALASADLYDPSNNKWSATASLSEAREKHTATLLPNGKILAIGGYGGIGVGALASAKLYDSAAATTGDAPNITSSLTEYGTAGAGFSYTITATGTATITFTAAPLPAGLYLSGAVITGVPTRSGTYLITLTAANSQGSDTETLALVVVPAAAPPNPPNPNNGGGGGPGVEIKPFNLMSIKRSKKNTVTLKATLPVPAHFTAANQSVSVTMGESALTFALNAQGKAASSTGKCSITWKKKGFVAQDVRFQCVLNMDAPPGETPVRIAIGAAVFTARAMIK